MDGKKREAPVRFGVFLDFVESMAKETCAIFKEHADRTAALERRLAELEARLAQVETKGIEYRGVWSQGTLYKRGDFVTRAGCMWAANCETYSKPGESADWQLAVKSGKDAKDAR